MPNSNFPVRRRKIDSARTESQVAALMSFTYAIDRAAHERRRPDKYRADSMLAVDSPGGSAFEVKYGKHVTNRKRRQDSEADIEVVECRRTTIDVWIKLARIVISNNLEPVKFVHRQFAILPCGSDSPMPQAMLGADALANYDAALAVSMDELRTSLQTQIMVFKTASADLIYSGFVKHTQADAWASVLRNPTVNLSAMFRYCMAVSLQSDSHVTDSIVFEKIARQYLRPAAMQYVFEDDAYEAISGWRQIMPVGWAVLAHRTYDDYHGLSAGDIHG